MLKNKKKDRVSALEKKEWNLIHLNFLDVMPDTINILISKLHGALFFQGCYIDI